MSYTELSEKEVKTRKVHRCEWCNEGIEIGEQAHARTYLFDGDFCSGHLHPECWDAMDRSDTTDLEDGWTPGDFKRGVAAGGTDG